MQTRSTTPPSIRHLRSIYWPIAIAQHLVAIPLAIVVWDRPSGFSGSMIERQGLIKVLAGLLSVAMVRSVLELGFWKWMLRSSIHCPRPRCWLLPLYSYILFGCATGYALLLPLWLLIFDFSSLVSVYWALPIQFLGNILIALLLWYNLRLQPPSLNASVAEVQS